MATEFSGVFGSEIRDTQGEILDVRGADISELEAGRGVVNDNHSNKLPDVVGRVTYAKKIFGPEDCEDDDQKAMWSKIKAPMIYGRGLLFDDEDHRSAKAAAAIIRHQHSFDAPLKMKCSVEGGILERGKSDERVLKRTKIKGLALTLSPANNATVIQGLNLRKSATTPEEQQLIKSYKPQAEVPTFIEVADQLSKAKIVENIRKINAIVKELKKNTSDVSDIHHHLSNSDYLSIDEVPKTKNSHSKLPPYRQPIYTGRIGGSLSKANLSVGLEPLLKANYKTLKPMLPEPEHDHVVKWTADNIKHPPLQSWYLRNYKKDNTLHTPDNQSKIQHYDGMTKVDDSFKNVDLGKHVDFKTGLNSLANADKKFQNSKTHLIHEPEGEKMIDFGNGMAWWNLKKPSSQEEGRAMGHCGNAGEPHENDTVLSLRREHKIGSRNFYEPMATFIHNQNHLGEMKGKANRKPSEETHPYIADLLSHPDVHGATGGQYATEGDFHFDDLNPELQSRVKKANPKFVDIRSDAFSDEEKNKAIDNVPNVDKMQTAVKRHLKRKEILDGINSGSKDPSKLSDSEITHVSDHPSITSKQVNRAFKNAKDSNSLFSFEEGDGADRAFLEGTHLLRNPKLNVDQAVKEHPELATHLGKRLTDKHIDSLVSKAPSRAAANLKDRIKDHHVDSLVQKAPADAAANFKDRLKDHHVDHLMNTDPVLAVSFLKDRLTDKHIDDLVKLKPHVAAFNLDDRLTDKHIDHIIKEEPELAAKILRDRMTPEQLEKLGLKKSISESKKRSSIGKINALVKTLSAGYGGAGAPSNLTGGGVLQSESMAQKSDDSKVECPDCGKEQFYLKYQTRCRHCSRSFPMDTLVKYFIARK